jgi:hypothetical protein
MADNDIITTAMINNLQNSINEIQRLNLNQLFVSSLDNTSVKNLPIIGDLASSGIVVYTTTLPFSLSTTSKSYVVPFANGLTFNEMPTISFAVQMDNANFGVVPIITNLTKTSAGMTITVVSGSPASTNLVVGKLHITAIGYH